MLILKQVYPKRKGNKRAKYKITPEQRKKYTAQRLLSKSVVEEEKPYTYNTYKEEQTRKNYLKTASKIDLDKAMKKKKRK